MTDRAVGRCARYSLFAPIPVLAGVHALCGWWTLRQLPGYGIPAPRDTRDATCSHVVRGHDITGDHIKTHQPRSL